MVGTKAMGDDARLRFAARRCIARTDLMMRIAPENGAGEWFGQIETLVRQGGFNGTW